MVVRTRRKNRRTFLQKGGAREQELMNACALGNSSAAMEIIRGGGVNLNVKDQHLQTPLLFAALKNLPVVVQTLIEKGADVNAQSTNGLTALIAACDKSHQEIALELLKHRDIDVSKMLPDGRTARAFLVNKMPMVRDALHAKIVEVQAERGKKLLDACANLDSSTALAIIKAGFVDFNFKNELGETALIWASINNLFEVANAIIKKGADVNAKTTAGVTALLFACSHSNSAIALELLLQPRIDVTSMITNGRTALSLCGDNMRDVAARIEQVIATNASDASKALGKQLIDACILSDSDTALRIINTPGVDLNYKNIYGQTPLYIAVLKNLVEVAKVLIEKGADVNAQNNHGDTPLILACGKENRAIALEILTRSDIDVLIKSNNGTTAMLANKMPDVKTRIEEIIAAKKSGGSSVAASAPNTSGNASKALGELLNKAKGEGSAGIVAAAAAPMFPIIPAALAVEVDPKVARSRVLFDACERGDSAGALKIIADEENLPILCKFKSEAGDTPLIMACIKNLEYVVRALLNSKQVDVNAANTNTGYTPLMYACLNNFTSIQITLFVYSEHDVDFRVRAKDGETALSLIRRHSPSNHFLDREIAELQTKARELIELCKAKKEDAAVSLLTKERVDANFADETGDTPLIHAIANHLPQVAKILINKKIVDINAYNRNCTSMLILACYHKQWDIAKDLVDRPGIKVHQETRDGRTALTLIQSTLGNSDDKKRYAAKQFLDEQVPFLMRMYAEYGKKLLLACKTRDSKTAINLIEKGNADLNVKGDDNATPLMYACKAGLIDVVKSLLNTKSVHINSKTNYGNTALMFACSRKHETIALALLEEPNIDVNIRANNGETALSLCEDQMPAVIARITSPPLPPMAAAPVAAPVAAAPVAAPVAAAPVAAPVAAAPVMVAVRDVYEQERKLLEAISASNEYVAMRIIETNKLDLNFRDKEGNTPLLLAANNGLVNVASALIARGADINLENSKGTTPLIITLNKYNNVKTKTEPWGIIARKLLEEGAINVNKQSGSGATALSWACWNNQTTEVRILLGKGANINTKDNKGNTPLMYACENNSVQVVEHLVFNVRGIDFYASNDKSQRAINLCSKPYLREIIKDRMTTESREKRVP